METRETILQELRELSPAVANLSRKNTFQIPVNYFEHLPEVVLDRIYTENIVFGEKAAPFQVPAGYFDGLAGKILQQVTQQREQSVEEELNEIAPLLNTISKKPVHAVPGGYFESLELTVPLKLAKPSAKVFSFGKSKRIMQYAVAACTAGILFIGAYLFTNQRAGNSDAAMAIPYDAAMKMNVSQALSSVNEQEINQYLEESPSVGYAINTSASDEVEIEESIETATDDEINEYLNLGS